MGKGMLSRHAHNLGRKAHLGITEHAPRRKLKRKFKLMAAHMIGVKVETRAEREARAAAARAATAAKEAELAAAKAKRSEASRKAAETKRKNAAAKLGDDVVAALDASPLVNPPKKRSKKVVKELLDEGKYQAALEQERGS
jgi:hypothetical protein